MTNSLLHTLLRVTHKKGGPTVSPPPATNPLDSHVNSEWMRVCKCILPYLDRSTQKHLAISLKFMELMSVINLYSQQNAPDPISLTREGSWEKDLLHNVRSNLSADKAFIIDAVLKISEAKNILSQHKQEPNQSNPSDSLSLFNPADPTDESTAKDSPTLPDDGAEQSSSPSSGGPSFNPMDMIEKLSPLLDDNQRQMIQLFSTLMK